MEKQVDKVVNGSEALYEPQDHDKIRIVLCKDGEVVDSVSVTAKPKSKLLSQFVKLVRKIFWYRDKKRSNCR